MGRASKKKEKIPDLLCKEVSFDKELCFEFFNATSEYAVIDLVALSKGDKARLKELGFSIPRLKANAQSVKKYMGMNAHFGDSVIFFKVVGKIKSYIYKLHNYFARQPSSVVGCKQTTKFQRSMCRDGCMLAICPQSGRLISSTKSLIFAPSKWTGTIFYRFEGKETFYIVTGLPSHAFRKQYLYFPKHELVVFLSGAKDKHLWHTQELNDFKANMVFYRNDVIKYLRFNTPAKKVALVSTSHFAHHIWNELSGIQSIVSMSLLSKIDLFAVFHNPTGLLGSIFPELKEERIKQFVAEAEEGTFTREALRRNYFVFKLGGNYIHEELAERICNVAHASVPQSVLDDVSCLRKKHFPIIWFSLRTDYRTCESQPKGIAWIINQLALKYPNLYVLLDGFSIPYGCSESYIDNINNIILQQKKVAREIKSLLKTQVECRYIIGTSIHESIVWSYATDAYVCHHGSIQHKIGWIANKPGVIHTNSLSAKSGKNHSTYWARENAYQPTIISGQDSEQPINKPNMDARNNLQNYKCDWCKVYRELLKVLEGKVC